ncbi:MAG TPA: alpha/beta hydrolase [Acidimicrobiaceae bacterium]|nr:alpha/beta hydrolase [Acidimicrobiaceae bacterium]
MRNLTAFVLSGGGNLGAVQVGMLRALLEAGVVPEVIVGTSIGALNGAYLAGHPNLTDLEGLARLWRSVSRQEVFPLHVRCLVGGAMGHRDHLFETGGLRTLIRRADFGYERIEDAAVPFHAVATDVASGEAVILSVGSVLDALLASAAVPGVFPPVTIGGRVLFDGGVVANVPVLQAEAVEASNIYVLPTGSEDAYHPPSSAPEMMHRAMILASRWARREAIKEVSQRVGLHLLPVPPLATQHPSLFDFDATDALIDAGYLTTSRWLQAHDRGAFRSPDPSMAPSHAVVPVA